MLTITNEDCMDLMARYPDKYFELAIVDPPYGIGMDGGNVGYKGFNDFKKKNGIQQFQVANILKIYLGVQKIK